MTIVARYANHLCIAVVVVMMFAFSNPANTADVNPLRPAGTSSPRAALQGFVEVMDEIYLGLTDVIKSYTASHRLYLSPEEHRNQLALLSNGLKAARSLDTSQILPVLRATVAVERVLQLKEILDRIELPSFDNIPDREAMARTSSKRWRLPNTEIDIVLIESGPRAGEYLNICRDGRPTPRVLPAREKAAL